MFMIEGRSMPGYASVSPFGKHWEPITLSADDSMVSSVEEGITLIREMWECDRSGGFNDSMYRVRRLSDQCIVFSKG